MYTGDISQRTVEKYRSSIVIVQSKNVNGNVIHGTGFVAKVDDFKNLFVITNAHVIYEFHNIEVLIIFDFANNSTSYVCPGNVVNRGDPSNRSMDIAFINMSETCDAYSVTLTPIIIPPTLPLLAPNQVC